MTTETTTETTATAPQAREVPGYHRLSPEEAAAGLTRYKVSSGGKAPPLHFLGNCPGAAAEAYARAQAGRVAGPEDVQVLALPD